MSAALSLYAASILLAAAGGMEEEIKLCARISDAAARLACYDSLAGRTPEEGAPPAAASVEKFGLPPAQTANEDEINSIRSRLRGEFRGWEPGAQFTLENGQVWKCVGDDRAFYPDVPAHAEIVISKSYFGAYWMEITAIGRKIKVKRVK